MAKLYLLCIWVGLANLAVYMFVPGPWLPNIIAGVACLVAGSIGALVDG